jgi:hypothetical protein
MFLRQAARNNVDNPTFPKPASWRDSMTINIANLQPIVALAAGILILVIPRLLNFIVAIYLIVIGVLGLGLFR